MEDKLNTKNSITVSQVTHIHYLELNGSCSLTEGVWLVYVENGEIRIKSKSYSGILKCGQLLVCRTDTKYLFESIDDSASIAVVGFECYDGELDIFAKNVQSLSPEHKRMFAEVMKEGMGIYAPPYDTIGYNEIKKRSDIQFGAEQMLKNRLELMLIAMVRDSIVQKNSNEGTAESKMAEIRGYIDEHYKEKIQLDRLCFLFGTNKTTLCQCFKRLYGTTVLDYINGLRIKEAKRLICEKELSITRISEQLGFNSIHYFCRLFKKETGKPPTEYSKTDK